MTPRFVLGLALVTLLTTGAAVWVTLQQPAASPVQIGDEPAFPALREQPDAVAKVIVTAPEGTFTLTRAEDRWVAADRHDYPVAAGKLRELVVQLADMKLIEAKTSRPERYARLEVEDVAAGASSRQIRLEDADGKVLAEAIIGKQRQRLTGAEPSGTYLRRPGEAQSWLDVGPAPVDGGSETLRNTGAGLPPFSANSGAEYRLVVDFAQPDQLLAVQNIGNSGVPGTPHYADQFQAWLEGTYHVVSLRRADVESDLERSTMLEAQA